MEYLFLNCAKTIMVGTWGNTPVDKGKARNYANQFGLIYIEQLGGDNSELDLIAFDTSANPFQDGQYFTLFNQFKLKSVLIFCDQEYTSEVSVNEVNVTRKDVNTDDVVIRENIRDLIDTQNLNMK